MKKFLTKITVFSAPLLILFLIPAFFLRMSGENYQDIDDVVKNEKTYLIGYAYNEENYRYLKFKELENRKSLPIIALGSSRILQFRDKMFTKPFYNAGYTVSSLSNFVPFIKANFKDKQPKVLLINLDQWMFNEDWDDLADYGLITKPWEPDFRKNASIQTLFNVWSDLAKGKYGFKTVSKNQNATVTKIGLNALVNNKGFRKDGSIYYGDQIDKLIANDSTANDYQYSQTYSRIAEGTNRFEYGNRINPKAMHALNDLLLFCKNKGIYVVAFLPPFADNVHLRLRQSKKYSYMDSIYAESNTLFKEFGFELWDLSHLDKYGSSDSETIDGFHGGEVTYLKMLLYMAENGSVLQHYTNIDALKHDLDNRKNNYQVYD